jgi:hypothetical protein
MSTVTNKLPFLLKVSYATKTIASRTSSYFRWLAATILAPADFVLDVLAKPSLEKDCLYFQNLESEILKVDKHISNLSKKLEIIGGVVSYPVFSKDPETNLKQKLEFAKNLYQSINKQNQKNLAQKDKRVKDRKVSASSILEFIKKEEETLKARKISLARAKAGSIKKSK